MDLGLPCCELARASAGVPRIFVVDLGGDGGHGITRVRKSGGDGEEMQTSEGLLLSHPSLLLAER